MQNNHRELSECPNGQALLHLIGVAPDVKVVLRYCCCKKDGQQTVDCGNRVSNNSTLVVGDEYYCKIHKAQFLAKIHKAQFLAAEENTSHNASAGGGAKKKNPSRKDI